MLYSGADQSTKMKLVRSMGEELGVDVDYKIPVSMPRPSVTLESTTYFRAGEAIGTNVEDFNNPASRHTIDLVKNNLLPHCSTALSSGITIINRNLVPFRQTHMRC